MAAEYSRELSEKVFRGKSRLVGMGFWMGGMAGYGYRRLMISAAGKPKQKMQVGEAKSLTTDRVILNCWPTGRNRMRASYVFDGGKRT